MTEFAFLGLVFGLQAWRQYRRSGDSGFRGFKGSLGDRTAGTLFAVALLALLVAPFAARTGLLACAALPAGVSALGVVLAVAVLALVLFAQKAMGGSWRVGVDRSERTMLVTDGLFGVVRNPVFSAIGLFGIGFLLLVPNLLTAFGLVLGGIGIELQVRLVEEPYLLETHGKEFAVYARKVGRFLPLLGRLQEGDAD